MRTKTYRVAMKWADGEVSITVETDEGWLGAQVLAMTIAVREHGAKNFTKVEVTQ